MEKSLIQLFNKQTSLNKQALGNKPKCTKTPEKQKSVKLNMDDLEQVQSTCSTGTPYSTVSGKRERKNTKYILTLEKAQVSTKIKYSIRGESMCTGTWEKDILKIQQN